MHGGRWVVLGAGSVAVSCSLLLGDDDLVGKSGPATDGGGIDTAAPEVDAATDGAVVDDPCPTLPPALTLASVPPTMADCDDAGTSTDLQSSFAHCGTCEHHCGQQSCASGICTPTTVVSEPTATAICSGRRGSALAWAFADDAGLTIRTRDDAAAIVDIAKVPGSGAAFGLRFDDAGIIIYRPARGVYAVEVDGGTRLLSDSSTTIWTADDDTVYYADTGSSAQIYARPRDGGARRTIVGAPWVERLSISGGQLFWQTAATVGAVRSLDLASGKAVLIADKVAKPGGFHVDALYVYVADGAKLLRYPRTGGPSQLLADFSSLGGSIVGVGVTRVKERLLWYVRDEPETFRRLYGVDRCGRGTPMIIAKTTASCLTVIDDDLYWASTGHQIDRFR